MAFVFLSNFSTILYFLTVYLKFVGFSAVAISSMLLAYQLSKFLLEIPTGYISDRFGRKTSGVLGIIGVIVYYLALLFSRSPLVLIVSFALKGLSIACLSGSFEAIYIDSVPASSLVRLNVIERFIFYTSYGLSALLGGWISVSHAYQFGLACDIAAMTLSILVVLGMKEPKSSASVNAQGTKASVKAIARMVCKNKALVASYIMDASQAFAFVALEDYFTMLLNDRGMDSIAAGLTVAVQLIISAAIGFVVPALISKVNENHFARVTACIRLLLTAAFLLPITPVWLLPTLYVLQTIAYALFAPIKYSLFQNTIEPAWRCSMISVQSQMVALGAIAFYVLNTALCACIGVRSVLLVALVLSAGAYVPALFRLTKTRSSRS